MRVLYSFPDTVGSPGIGVVAFHQATGLVDLGCEVTLSCTHLARPIPGLAELVQTLTVKGRRIPHRAMGIGRSYAYHDRRTASLVRRGRFDVVHCWPRGTVATASAAKAAGAAAVREVPNTHTGYAFETVAAEHELLGLPPIRGHSHTFDAGVLRLEEHEFEVVDLLLVPSELSRRTFLDRGVPEERLALHQYGFDPARFPPPGDRQNRPFTALFAARCEPRKGLHYALQAWHESGSAQHGKLVVLGEFVPGYRDIVEQGLAHPSVEERGFVNDLPRVMGECDVLVHPSVEDGSALVTYDAQAAGCVLAASDAAGARFVHGRHGLLHRPRDVATLTEHLRLLSSDESALAGMRSAVIAERDRLTWAKAATELVEIYDRAVAARNGSA
jgi:glycosyltransferase involved in cell wall biosynthesis